MMRNEKKINFVGKDIYVIMLIQASPGAEQKICDALLDKLEKTGVGKQNSHLFFSFSEFDIVALIQLGDSYDIDEITNFTNPQIRDFQQVVCYSYYGWESAFKAGGALTLTLLKIDEKEIAKEGINTEKAVLRLAEPIVEDANEKGVHTLLLGTLGWSETILIQTGDNIQILLDNIAAAFESKDDWNLQISHTFPCVKRVENLNDVEFQYVTGTLADWRIAVSSQPQSVFFLKHKIEDFQKEKNIPAINVLATFGRRDLVITPQKLHDVQVQDFLPILRELRTEYVNYIVSTHTDISISLKTGDTHTDYEPVIQNQAGYLEEDFEKLEQRLKKFSEWEKRRKNITLGQSGQLNQMTLRMRAIAATPGFEGIVEVLFDFVKATVEKAISQSKFETPLSVNKSNRDAYVILEDMIKVFQFSLEQRMAGARFGLGHPSQAYSNLQGLGIQRILQASRAVANGLLRSVNLGVARKWWGYTVFGYQNDTFIMNNGVINLPFQDMFRPEEWWRLGHESGHAFGTIANVIENPAFAEAIQDYQNSAVDDTDSIYSTIDEMAASVFEYLYCYRGDYDLYLKTTWRFFDQLLEGTQKNEKIQEYLLRSVFVYFFHLQVHGVIEAREKVDDVINAGQIQRTLFDGDTFQSIKKRAFGEETSLEMLIIHNILDKIDKEDAHVIDRIKYAVRSVSIKVVADDYRQIEFVRSAMADFYLGYQEPDQNGNNALTRFLISNLGKRLHSVYKDLGKGRVFTDFDNELDVFLIPLALQYQKNERKKKISQRARVAAILSLWNANRMQYHADRFQEFQ